MRFVVLYYNLLSGKLHIPKETLQLLLDYPNLSHEDEKMRTIRPLVRSMEIVPVEIDPYNEGYLDIFWESVSRMSDCELFYIEHAEEVLETKRVH